MNTVNLRKIYDEKLGESRYPLWHPYASINKNFNNTLNIGHGIGCYIYDCNGKKYLDASSGLWNVSLGYSNESIKQAIIEQLERLPYTSLFDHTNSTAVQAAGKILGLLPSYMQKVFFTCSGSESIELSIKMMRMYWKFKGKKDKRVVLSLKDSYHGTYYGSLSASNIESRYISDIGPMLSDFQSISLDFCMQPNTRQDLDLYLKKVDEYIYHNYQNICGIIIEPILASEGVKILGNDVLEHLYRICKKFDILFCMDEVATGFYRTGKAFYFNYLDVEPDIICLSKGINSGYLPLGAVVVRDSIRHVFQENDELMIHGSTQDGNLLACAACIAAIEQYEQLGIEENVMSQGEFLLQKLRNDLVNYSDVYEIRGVGLMLAIDFHKGESNKGKLLLEVNKVQMYLREKGLIVYRSESGITILPMLITNREEALYISESICEALGKTAI